MINRKKRFGDRKDGRLIRSIDTFNKIVPYIFKNRIDSQVFFEDKLPIDNVEEFLQEKRTNGIKNITFLHIFIAALVRTISQKPGLNRFISGQKIYARKEIAISFVVKKQLNENSPETTVKLLFNPTDTLMDVVDKVNSAIASNKGTETTNSTDKTAKMFMFLPGFLIKFLVWFIETLDHFGIMPKALNDVSPFHTSIFLTDVGSLGIPSVSHHLYEFGTCSIFAAFGLKQREKFLDSKNNLIEKRYIRTTFTIDERITDGYYLASSMRFFVRLMKDPKRLETPPDKIVEDIE